MATCPPLVLRTHDGAPGLPALSLVGALEQLQTPGVGMGQHWQQMQDLTTTYHRRQSGLPPRQEGQIHQPSTRAA